MISSKFQLKGYRYFVILIIVIAITVIFASTKAVLYIKFILGSDIVAVLNTDKETLALSRGQNDTITFDAKVTTNPFCKAVCNITFLDISSNRVVDQSELSMQPGISHKSSYTIIPNHLGSGVELYRYSIECHALKTLLCHTKEIPTTRSLLVTLNYNLSAQEEKDKDDYKIRIEMIGSEVNSLYQQQTSMLSALARLNQTIAIPPGLTNDVNYLGLNISSSEESFESLSSIWESQDYLSLSKEINLADNQLSGIKNLASDANLTLVNIVDEYDALIDDVLTTQSLLEEIRTQTILNDSILLQLSSSINYFNQQSRLLSIRSDINSKSALYNTLNENINITNVRVNDHLRRETIAREFELNLNYDTLCTITGVCIEHSSTSSLSNMSEFSLKKTCLSIDALHERYSLLNQSINLSNVYYPDSAEFWNNMSILLKGIKNNLSRSYSKDLVENSSNYAIVKRSLDVIETEQPQMSIENYPELNLTAALIKELISNQPERCNIPNLTIRHVNPINITKIKPEQDQNNEPLLNAKLKEPKQKCCVFNKCRPCCIAQECIADNSLLPVIFLHGHAVNKDLSAEYSLEGFNSIQNQLEKDGFLNAGSVNLFTIQGLPTNVLSPINVPLTFRVSYYVDIFSQPENYIAVQTNSENIDTYAVRLKELIDAVLIKTDKPKVKIVAFSMGGLVARRYLQIFGDGKVDRLIMIGTPNNGIVGRVSDYCPIVGEKLECNDMNADSLFINKLNRGSLPSIPIHNIVGTGCSMKEGQGDGVVLENKARLQGAINYIIQGRCRSTVYPLHLDLRDIELYPEVYDIVREVLS